MSELIPMDRLPDMEFDGEGVHVLGRNGEKLCKVESPEMLKALRPGVQVAVAKVAPLPAPKVGYVSREELDGSVTAGMLCDITNVADAFARQVLGKEAGAAWGALVDRIVTNGRTTVTIWKDGSKTKVTLMDGEEGSVYGGFLWCLGERIFGSRTRLEKLVDSVHVDQDEQRRQKEERTRRKNDVTAL